MYKNRFTARIYRDDPSGGICVSHKKFLTFAEARRYGGHNLTISKIVKVDDDNDTEIVIYQRGSLEDIYASMYMT